MYRRRSMTERLRSFLPSRVALPVALLAVLSVASFGARVAGLGEPCRTPCATAHDHVLVFDEAYYVNAARVIAGLRPPPGAHYADAPAGVDPNSEHPQLAKLMIAGSIELFGDGPFAWRIAAIVFGSLAILGIYVLVRSAGGGRWLALGASALMACDNLLLVHGRIGTLDIFAVTAMIWAAALYLRNRPLVAGAVVGLGACFKLVAPYVLIVFALVEVLRLVGAWRDTASRSGLDIRGSALRLGVSVLTAAVVLVGLLAVLDAVAHPFDATAGKRIAGGPFGHLSHMISYAENQQSPNGPTGIASSPWEWFGDYKPITYLMIQPSDTSREFMGVHPQVHFLGMINPAILVLALPGLAFAGWVVLTLRGRRQTRLGAGLHGGGPELSEVSILSLAWVIGTYAPFVLLSVIWSRTSYLYYMVIVMPGVYIAVAQLVARIRVRWRWPVWLWGLGVLAGIVVMYPLTPWP
jgi:predicted membrane-bound dolichyl-phosphate-mannose-protein mannosyltransferase